MIATSGTPVTGDHVPRLEHILNRLKAEFGTARLLYYQATTDQSWDLHEHEITYAELFEGETVSMRTELLRTSFRLCLGILDKIALGICELYDVADPHEKLYFESFWQPSARKGKAGDRWTTLTAKSKNPALVALYSQADLRIDGEWAQFKAWRNDLEQLSDPDGCGNAAGPLERARRHLWDAMHWARRIHGADASAAAIHPLRDFQLHLLCAPRDQGAT